MLSSVLPIAIAVVPCLVAAADESSIISSAASAASSVVSSAAASASATASNATANATSALAPFGNTSVLFAQANVSGQAFGDVFGTVNIYGYLNGSATHVDLNMTRGLTNTTEQYMWHFHTNYIPADGNCTAALAHLDPHNITESVVCDPALPQYCQEGDMSGKHGYLNGSESGAANQSFDDAYLRFFPGNYSILGRSVVVHFANKTRIACGNVTSLLDGTAIAGASNNSLIATNVTSNYTTVYPSVAPPNPNVTVTPFAGSSTISKAAIPTGGAAVALSEAVTINSSGGTALPTGTRDSSAAGMAGYPVLAVFVMPLLALAL